MLALGSSIFVVNVFYIYNIYYIVILHTVSDKTMASICFFLSYNTIFHSNCFLFLVFKFTALKLHILKCLLLSFFLLPVIFEKNLIHREKTIATLFA